jgi:uncharacterized protein YodC (DUF2158 family)
MDFLRTGFTRNGDCRCHRFNGKGNDQAKKMYDIVVVFKAPDRLLKRIHSVFSNA